jgi:hypothetical protein
MKVWVFVEGEADRIALEALWLNWWQRLRAQNHDLSIIPVGSKHDLLKAIGWRTARALQEVRSDIVVGLPDLYPSRDFVATPFAHESLEDLQELQRNQVRQALADVYRRNPTESERVLRRFYAGAMKYDLEMLLLAAKDELCQYLGIPRESVGCRDPVEEQDEGRPPKNVVQDLFLSSTTRGRYRPTRHARAVLSRVRDLRRVIFDHNGQVQCPAFKAMLDWLGEQTQVQVY